MSHSQMSQSQKERLRFIDFRLYFLAKLNRSDLIERFGIKEAAATRDISIYRDLNPESVVYDSTAKSYFKATGFKPYFSYKALDVLYTLATGIGDDSVIEQHELVPCEIPKQLNQPDVDILATLVSAISLKKSVSVEYYSVSSGESQREIVPFTLVNNGLRWHIRGYDRKRERFGDFVLTRFTKARISSQDPTGHELKDHDDQWNRVVELDLVPHPKHRHKKAIELDYQMKEGLLKVKVRAAVAGYLLRLWNVDCSTNHSLKGEEYHLWLKNTLALYGVDNITIAPGHSDE